MNSTCEYGGIFNKSRKKNDIYICSQNETDEISGTHD